MLSFLDEMDPFERDIFIIEKTCSLELSQIFQTHNALLYMEASDGKQRKSDKKKSGELVGMIQTAAKSISRMLQELINKIVSLFTGKKVDENKEVKYDKNPVEEMKAIDQSIRDDIDMIHKIKNGDAGMAEAKQLLNKHSSDIDGIEPYIGPIKAIAKEEIMSHAVVKRWKSEVDQVCHIKNKEMSAAARELAKSKYAKNQDEIIDQAVQMVLNDIQKNSVRGSNILLEFGKQFYVKKEVTDRLRKEADDMNSVSGGLAFRAGLRAERKRATRDARRAKREKLIIDINQKLNSGARSKSARAAEKLANANADRWNDVRPKAFTTDGQKKIKEDQESRQKLRRKTIDSNTKISSIDTDDVVQHARESRKKRQSEEKNPIKSKIKAAVDKGSLVSDTDIDY